MLRQLRALFHSESPLPAHLHYHVDDEGKKFICDDSVCRPTRPWHSSGLVWPPR